MVTADIDDLLITTLCHDNLQGFGLLKTILANTTETHLPINFGQ